MSKTQEEMMLAKGYAPAKTVAEKMGRHVATVYRMAEKGELLEMTVGHSRYISILSVVKYLGVPQSKLLGIVPEDFDASKLGPSGPATKPVAAKPASPPIMTEAAARKAAATPKT